MSHGANKRRFDRQDFLAPMSSAVKQSPCRSTSRRNNALLAACEGQMIMH